jgi:hypothetical protein
MDLSNAWNVTRRAVPPLLCGVVGAVWIVLRHAVWPTPPFTATMCAMSIDGRCVLGTSAALHIYPLPARVTLPWGDTRWLSAASSCRAYTFGQAVVRARDGARCASLGLSPCAGYAWHPTIQSPVSVSPLSLGIAAYDVFNDGAELVTGVPEFQGCDTDWEYAPGVVSVRARGETRVVFTSTFLDPKNQCIRGAPKEWIDSQAVLDQIRVR